MSKQNNPDGDTNFFGLTVKTDLFSKNMSKQNNPDGDTSQNDENTHEENFDPHYDPIIALPDEINVSTGEEEEEKLYGERAKLFRYDAKTKEWKERGKFR
jgi:E3 SUMO-protein ligase RanBP2